MSLLVPRSINFEGAWNKLEQSLHLMISDTSKGFSNDDWLQMYTYVYKICTSVAPPKGGDLYDRLHNMLENHCNSVFLGLESMPDFGYEFLRNYCKKFRNYETGMKYGAEMFAYLNRYWIKNSHCENGVAPIPGVYPVGEMSLLVWRTTVFTKLMPRIVSSILKLIRESRDAGFLSSENGSILVDAVKTFMDLGQCKQDPLKLYRENFEVAFVADTMSYYSATASRLIQTLSPSDYLAQVENLCCKEVEQCRGRFHRTSVAKAEAACYQALVSDYSGYLCGHAQGFLENGNGAQLRCMFSLFEKLGANSPILELKNIFRKFVEYQGSLVELQFSREKAFQQPAEYFNAILSVRKVYFDMVRDNFYSNPHMRSALDQACGAFFNANRQIPELLAIYAHQLMDTSYLKLECHSSSARPTLNGFELVESQIEKLGVVFSLLNDKDVFKKYYSKLLAKRLIRASSASDECEKFMIKKLRDICGHDFVAKLQRMFSDKDLSRSLTENFGKWVHENCNKKAKMVDSRIMVLTTGSWPMETPTNSFILPDELQRCIERFTMFYNSQSTGRRLHWALDLSIGDVVTHCFKKRYELQVNSYQIIILYLYNTSDCLSLIEIAERGKLSIQDARQNVEALIKAKVLVGDIEKEAQLIKLNGLFASKKTKLKIHSSTVQVNVKNESVSTRREIVEDRKMVIQAAIVRVMKARRLLKHAFLVEQVLKVLQELFLPEVIAIKENIEILIEKEYIRRIDEASDEYSYVA